MLRPSACARRGRSPLLQLELVRRQLFLGSIAGLVDGAGASLEARRALQEHDALAGGIADLFTVRSEVLDPFEHEPITDAHDLVRGPGAVAIAEVEEVSVHFPGAGAIRDAGLLAVHRDGESEPATPAGREDQRAALHEEVLAAAGADHPRADLADLDEPIDA